MKQYLLAILFSSIVYALHSQSNRLSWSVEYSPNFSKLTNDFRSPEFNFSQQFVGRIEYGLSQKVGLSIGLGYVNTIDRLTIPYNGQLGIDVIRLYTNHNYITLPVGLIYNLGPWFFRPEIAIGMNFSHPGRMMRQVSHLSNGEKNVIRWDDFDQREYNDLTFPVFLGIGREFRVNNVAFQFGAKGYYSLEKVILNDYWDQHYFGWGLLTGMRF